MLRILIVPSFLCLISSNAYAFGLPNAGSKQDCAATSRSNPIAPQFKSNEQLLIERLGWTPAANLCGGYFFESETLHAVPNPPNIDTASTTIATPGQVSFSATGTSVIEGGVTLTQPGREITAEQVILYRNQQTGKINLIDLQGNVAFREAGKTVVGEQSQLNLETKTATFSNGAYRIDRPSSQGPLVGWGFLRHAIRWATGSLSLDHTTYTTCSPTDMDWYLKADHLYLNKETGRGTARNAWLYGAGIPLLYTPYANFPIDNRRYSGFLYPSSQFDKQSGVIVNFPYYFNLAPNYDDTFTVSPMSMRGIQFNNLFRYLDTNSEATLYGGFLPNDHEFQKFKDTSFFQYPSNINYDPYLADLAEEGNNRSAVAFHEITRVNDNWRGGLDLNLVSDNYYLQDFGNGPQSINTDQLLNQAETAYQNENWQFLARLQAYQTLHLINSNFIQDQYKRLPQINLNASYPDSFYGLDFEFNSEWDNFQHVNDFYSGLPFPTGNRVHVSPQVRLPLITSWSFLTPSLALDLTGYNVANNGVINSSPTIISTSPTIISTVTPDFNNPDLNLVRTLPIFNIDTGLYLDRFFEIGSHQYKQTLEPRVFYLFVPEHNQNNIPIFDTTLSAFSFDQLFITNRFAGYDRISDANQLSLGLTSRLLDAYNGENKLDFNVGGIVYFQQPTVCLTPTCTNETQWKDTLSPLTALLNYYPNKKWALSSSAAWSPNQNSQNNAGLSLQFIPLAQHILKAGYNFVENGDPINSSDAGTSSANDLHRIDLGATWPLVHNWNGMVDWNYNISHSHPQSYLYGVEYNSCCWAVRFVGNRVLAAENNGNPDYRNSFYIQFLFKGLGSVGNNDAGKVLLSTFPNYTDYFRG